jgi:hypothetical protein
VVVEACNASTQEVEAGGWRVKDQSILYGKTFLRKESQIRTRDVLSGRAWAQREKALGSVSNMKIKNHCPVIQLGLSIVHWGVNSSAAVTNGNQVYSLPFSALLLSVYPRDMLKEQG